jgi:hypothetical protein
MIGYLHQTENHILIFAEKTNKEATMDRTKVVVGNTAVLEMDGLNVSVRIINTKQAFGRLDVLIEPVRGSGQKWVQCDRLQEGER